MQIEVSNGLIHAETHGEGTPVLVMHGGGLDHRHMLDALEPVFEATRGWRRVYIDLPGHGRSVAGPAVTCQDDVLGMITEFVDLAFDGAACAVIGESRGSYHAMGLVRTRPSNILGMMLVVGDGMPGSTVDWRPMHKVLETAPDGVTKDASAEGRTRFARLVMQRPDILEKIERTKVPASKLVDQRLAESIRENFGFGFDLTKSPVPFSRPCLMLNGRQDAVAGYQDMIEMVEDYPRATLAVLDGAGHSLAWEQPDLVEALTLNWLDRMRAEEDAIAKDR